jgi:hypothetical protein
VVRPRAPKQAVWRRRRVWPWALLALVLLAVAGLEAARLVRRTAGTGPPGTAPTASAGAAPAPLAVSAGEGTLKGIVVDAEGRPVPSVHVGLAPSDGARLVNLVCPAGETSLLLCDNPAAAPRLEEALLHPGASLGADTDGTGHFLFQHLAPAAYLVQAAAPSGWAVAERAPVGVPLRLMLRPYRVVQGRVVDEGGRPLGGARVRLLPPGLLGVREAASSTDGSFRVEGAGQSPLVLLVDAPGFLPSVFHLPSPEGGTVVLARPRTLVVRVSGDVPPELTARVWPAPAPGSAGPNLLREAGFQKGQATLSALPPGEVEVEALGLAVHAGPVRLRLREPETSVSLRLRASGATTVAVTDAQGQPVEACVVALRTPGGQPRQASATPCDTVELEPVPPGDYLLSAEAPGFRRAERLVHLSPGHNQLELQLEEGPSLAGRVLDEAGQPVPGVSLVVSPVGLVGRTDARGAFHVSVPGPGLYSVEAHHSEWGGVERAVTAPARDVVLRLQPRAVLELEVLAGGRPLEGALAVLFDVHDTGPGGQYQADRATGPDGRVRLVGFPPGTYTVGVVHPRAGSTPRQEVVLREGVTTALTVRLASEPRAPLDGQVVDEGGHPVDGASVGVRPFDAPPAETDADGRFRLVGLRDGVDYQLTARLDEAEPATAHARAGENGVRLTLTRGREYRGRVLDGARMPVHTFRVAGVEQLAEDGRFAIRLPAHGGKVAFSVESPPFATEQVVRPAELEALGDILLHAAPTVQGVVRDADGKPAGGALVVCEGCRGEDGVTGSRLTALSDARGSFSIPLVAAHGAAVRLVAMKEGRLGWAEAGRVGEEASLTLSGASAVSGRVLGPAGAPLAGVAVTLSEPLLDSLQLVTGEDGSFSGDVPPGVYQVKVVPDGSQPRRTWTLRVPTDRRLELVVGSPQP